MKKLINLVALAALLFAPVLVSAQALNEGFEESAFPPEGWTTIHVTGNNSWQRNTGTGSNGSSAFAYRKDVSGGYNDYLITPLLAPAAGDSLSFWLASQYAYSYAGTTLTIEVSTTTPTASSFTTVIATYESGASGTFGSSGISDWVNKKVDLSAYAGQQIYIAFHAVDTGYNADVRIDNVTGTSYVLPSCSKVKNLTAMDVDSSSITLSWTDTLNTGASYSVAYWVSTDTVWITSNTSSLTINDLNASTSYHFMVRALCSDTDSTEGVSTTIRTSCGQISLPYFVDFEDVTGNGAWYPCWDSTIHAGTDPSVNDQNSPANHTPNGTYAMYLQGNTSEPYNLVVSPRVPLDGDQIYVNFWAHVSSTSGRWLKAGVMTNPRDTSTFIPLVEVNGNAWNEYEFTTASLDPDASYYVAWLGYGQASWNTAFIGKFDDVTIRQDNGCNKPNMAMVDSVGPYSAYLTWTTGGASATAYDLFYGTLNNIDSAAVETVYDLYDTVHYELSGLQSQTTYHAWVRTACGNDSADAKYIGNFTTQLTCAPVLNATTSNISYTAAQIQWAYDTTQGFASEGVQITLVDNTDNTAEPVVIEEAGTNYTFSGLSTSHSYTATLRNMCEAEGQTDTAAAITVNFMTQSCSEVSAGTGTSNHAPLDSYYKYSYSQSIYTSMEMPNVDSIHGIAFYTTGTDTKTIEVYMGYTSLSTLSTNSYVPIENLSKVADTFSFAFSPGWNVINFDSTFFYDRTQGNLVIAVNNLTGEWTSNRSWATHATDAAQTVFWYQDASPINLTAPTATSNGTGNFVPAIRFVADCEVPTCFAPMLTLGAVDSANITVSWVATGTESEWAVGLKAEGATAITWNDNSVTELTYTFTDLTPNTQYTLYVGSICSGDTLLASISAKTACAPIILPFSTSFEGDEVHEAPSCWNVISSYSYSGYDYSTWEYVNIDYPSISTGAHIGNHSLGFVATGTPILIASSALPAEGQSLMVSFWAQTDDDDGYATLTLEAGLMTDLTANSTFVPYVTLTGTNDYANHEFATPVLNSDSTYYLAFRYTATDYWGNAEVDDIEIRPDDGCHRSTNVVAFSIDTSEIEVNWSNDGETNSYVVEYRIAGTSEWAAIDNLTYTNCTIPLLATSTAYEIRVGTVCTSDTLWVSPVKARTACSPMELPYSTSFENDSEGEMPSCWNTCGAIGSNYSGTTFPSVSTYGHHTGTKELTFSDISDTSIVSIGAVPLAGDSIHVSFWARMDVSGFASSPTLEGGVMTNPAIGSTFIPLVTLNTNSSYQFMEFNTSTLSHDSAYHVAFRYSSYSDYNEAAIDDINIRAYEGCMYPSNLTATPNGSDIDLAWTNTGSTTNFAIEYRMSGSTWSIPVSATSSPYTLTSLNASTAYEARVGTVCGTDTLWTSVSFQTNCGLMSLPYSEDFEAYANDVMPPCWIWSSTYCTHWDGGVFLRAYHGGGSEYVVLPQLNGNIAKLKIEFDTKVGTPAENDGILIGVTDATGTLLTWLDTIQDPLFSRNNHVRKTVYFTNYNIPGGAERVAFAQYRNWGEWGLIDNINIEELPDCYPVDNLVGSNLNDPEATTFTWHPQGDATQWQIYVDTVTVDIDSLANLPDSLFINVYDTTYTIPIGMIQGGGIYNFFVRSVCSATDHSGWVKNEFGAGTIIMNNSSVADTIVGCGFVVYDNGGPIPGYLPNSNSALVIRTENVGSQLQIFGGKFGFGSSPATLTVYDGEGTSGTVLYTYNTVDGRDTLLNTVLATSTTGSLTITFVVNGGMCHTGYELYVRCTDGAICPRPTELQAEMTSASTADVTWTGTASNYNFYYRLHGAATWVRIPTTTNSVSLVGLAADTIYDMYVMAICSATDSSTASAIRQLHTSSWVEPQVYYNVTVRSSDESMGTATADHIGSVVENTVVTAIATPNNGFRFTAWTDADGHQVDSNRIYTFTLTSDVNLTAHFERITDIEEVNGANIALFPNPASSTVTLSGIEGTARVTVIDMNGRVSSEWTACDGSLTIDVSKISQGAYFVRIVGEQVNAIRKLIVK